MSEYIIGDRITTQPYALTESDRNAVGIRVYGPAGKTGMDYMPNDHYFVIFQAVDVSMLLDVGETALTGGEIADVFEGWDNDGYSEITDIVSVSDWIADKSEIVCFNPNEPVDVDFALIFEGGTHMTTITERIATIEVDGSETVKFAVSHDVYGVYGEDIIASLKEGASEGDEGAYSTAGTGKAIIAHYTGADTLYLTGSGTVTVWAGQSPLDDPFAV
jgi:hypothetical protein